MNRNEDRFDKQKENFYPSFLLVVRIFSCVFISLYENEKNKAGYTAQDAASTRLKITRDRRTYVPMDLRTDGRTQPLIEMRRRIKKVKREKTVSCFNDVGMWNVDGHTGCAYNFKRLQLTQEPRVPTSSLVVVAEIVNLSMT